jgi:hypothetical protein
MKPFQSTSIHQGLSQYLEHGWGHCDLALGRSPHDKQTNKTNKKSISGKQIANHHISWSSFSMATCYEQIMSLHNLEYLSKILVKFWKFVLHDFEHSGPFCKYEVHFKFENIIQLNKCIEYFDKFKIKIRQNKWFFFLTNFIIFWRKKSEFFWVFCFFNVIQLILLIIFW